MLNLPRWQTIVILIVTALAGIFALPNVLLGRRAFPELLQRDATTARVVRAADSGRHVSDDRCASLKQRSARLSHPAVRSVVVVGETRAGSGNGCTASARCDER